LLDAEPGIIIPGYDERPIEAFERAARRCPQECERATPRRRNW
jgi:hypothetical protein